MILNSNVILYRQGIIAVAAELVLVLTASIINSSAIVYPQAGADNAQFTSAISSQQDNKDVRYKFEHNLCIIINCVTTAMHIHIHHSLLYSSDTPLFGFTTIYKDDLIKRNSAYNSMSSQPISLLITTDKQSYNLSETVNITIKNVGNQSLTFSDSALGLRIKNLDTGEIYRPVAAQVLTELNPNESKSLKWKQEDNDGAQIKSGNFNASVTSGPLSANTTFKIEPNP